MKRNKLPTVVLNKLIELDEQVEDLTRKLANTEQGIADAHRRLSGGFRKQAEYDDLSASLKELAADKPTLEKKLHTAQSVLSNCKAWLDRLPEGTTLEPVEVKTDGHDLEEVRAKGEAAQAERAALRAAPTPSADIEQRIRQYVYSMARPQITGICKGERLKIVWPGADFDTRGPREDSAKVLPMMALLFPDRMTAALISDVERMANDPLPQAERKKRIAALEREIEQLAYVEEAMVAAAIARGEDVQRSPSAPPQAVLGVKVVEARRVTRAA
jgi:chromosome segregation ATPase